MFMIDLCLSAADSPPFLQAFAQSPLDLELATSAQ